MLRIGVISAYPAEDWHAQRIARSAALCGDARVLRPIDFSAEMGRTRRLLVAGEDANRYDVFLTPRALGDEGEPELQLELYRTLAEEGHLLVNAIQALTVAIDKFKSTWLFARAGLPMPLTIVAQRADDVVKAVRHMGHAVVKPLYGSLGVGIELLDGKCGGDLERAVAMLGRHGALCVQAYVEQPGQLDVRAFVVGGRVEVAMARHPRPGDFRSNAHQGADARPHTLDAKSAEVAIRAAELVGLEYSGVDFLCTPDGPQLIEVNGTPAFRAIYEATGRDMAPAIVHHALTIAWRRRRRAPRTAHPFQGGIGPHLRRVAERDRMPISVRRAR